GLEFGVGIDLFFGLGVLVGACRVRGFLAAGCFFGAACFLCALGASDLAVVGGIVAQDLSGCLGLRGLIDFGCVVHDLVCLLVCDGDAFVGGVVTLAVDVHRPVFGGVARLLVASEHVACLAFVLLARLLGRGGPIGVVEMLLGHWFSLFRSSSA